MRAVDRIHRRALAAAASDVHVEPTSRGGRVRLRVDGLLRDDETILGEHYAPVVSRIKVLAGMDIAEKRQPQDGRYTIESEGRSIDARVCSVPTVDGEKLVIRLLDPSAGPPQLESLGMSVPMLERYRALIHAPYGFVVITGPTGSGKTTTLYGSLAEIDARTRSVVSVEDPVEMRIAGVSQVHVNPRAGLTFAVALRSFFRADPNVVMIGEMRDSETASAGIAAALSGQLVLTTLHGSDAPRTVERLLELGARRAAVAAALSAIVSQRLVRRLCCECRGAIRPPDVVRRRCPELATIGCAVGCQACSNTGYAGRVGIFELLEVTEPLRDAIAAGASSGAIAQLAGCDGYAPMWADATEKLAAGETSFEELSRVILWTA